MDISTARLGFEPLGEDTDPDEVLEVVNSNPDWVAASADFAGRASWDRSDAEMMLWVESVRENSVPLGVRTRGTAGLVGVGGLVEPHPDRGVPMIGLLLVHGEHQRQGLGTEAAAGIRDWLGDRGWDRVLVTVLEACPGVRVFWEGRGFEVVELTRDQDKRSVWVLERRLGP